ncbi:hypothetical protein [Kutzneria buriramensis]|uniref:Uncharacterized protein n=1 Tax=Kutzneria buriramensis TaxID=1045776 RepID=A0A3E0G5M8_9PSEU|nr:hypothetical protein [Kutzneria buriramensis]REH17982.1 hypothetical protein BCF44_13914 [Kutzneria buriramensis]
MLTIDGTSRVTYGADDAGGGGISTGATGKAQNVLSSQVLGIYNSNSGAPVVRGAGQRHPGPQLGQS